MSRRIPPSGLDGNRPSDHLKLAAVAILCLVPGARRQAAPRLARRRATMRAVRRFRACAARLGPRSLAVDVGANVGDVTEFLAARAGLVHAFEPDPWAFERLSARVGHLPNVVLHQAAVGLRTGRVGLARSTTVESDPAFFTRASSTCADVPYLRHADTVDVDEIDFLDFLRRLDRPVDLLKIDIEGAEVALLEALLASLERTRIVEIFAETHDLTMPALAARTQALRQSAAGRQRPAVNLDWV